MTGSIHDDELRGTDGSNYIDRRQGDDHIEGRASDDVLDGWAGDDTVDGGDGIDECRNAEVPIFCEV